MFPIKIKYLNYKILHELEDKDLIMLCQSNQDTKNLCNDQQFWFSRIRKKFPIIPTDVILKYKGDQSWSDYYIYDLREISLSNLPPNRLLINQVERNR